MQWCFITESLNESVHEKGAHGYGTLLRTNGRVTFHHNLYAHHQTRCPRPGTYGEGEGLLLDFRNNVVYDWGTVAGYSAEDPARMDYVANFLRPGPSSQKRTIAFHVGGTKTLIYPKSNMVEGVRTKRQWVLFDDAEQVNRAKKPLTTPLVKTDSPQEAFERVLAEGGASLPQRDSVDARVVSEVSSGGGRIIDSQEDVGAWPEYPAAAAPADGDADGMPDDWETRYGLDAKDPTDAVEDTDGDGYTNIEEYVNGTRPAH